MASSSSDLPFHPVTARWFAETLDEPTAAQRRGWASIRDGRHTLIAAPTGSGKTLAAFLTALDDLLQEGLRSPLPDEVRVVYVSPLKALSADIHKNLSEPRRGSAARGRGSGFRCAARDGRRPHRRHAAGRACGDAADAAAHPGDDSRVAVSPADGGAQPRDVAHGPHRHRRRNPRGHRHASRGAPRAQPGTAAGGGDRAARFASASPPRRSRLRKSRGSWSGTDPPLTRPAWPTAASWTQGIAARWISAWRFPRSPLDAVMAHEVWEEYYDRLTELIAAASHNTRFRQHAADGRAARAPPERSHRRSRGHRAPRQPVEGEAARCGVAAQGADS